MEFLKTLFGADKTNSRTVKASSRRELQALHLAEARPQQVKKRKIMQAVQQKLFQKHSACKANQPPAQDTQPLNTRFVVVNQQIDLEFPSKIDCGLLVGVINHQKRQNSLLGDCIPIFIGETEEVNYINALRSHSLDSLLVFWNQGQNQFNLNQLLKMRQRFIFVMDQWETVQTFIKNYESALFQLFAEKTIADCSDKLLFNIYQIEHKFVLQFCDQQKFTIQFINSIKKTFPSLSKLEDLEQLQSIMTLEEYSECCQYTSEKSFIKSKISIYKDLIQKNMEEKKKKEQLQRIDLLLEAEAAEELPELIQEPVRKNSSIEADLEAEYFGKQQIRTSQQETRESGSSKRQENQELYYFIEEHDESESNDLSYEHRQSNSDPIQSPDIPTRLVKSKSWNLLPEPKEQELDQEFFAKY